MITYYPIILSLSQDVLPLRPSSGTKQSKTNLLHHPRRNILVDSNSNVCTYGDNSSGTSSLEQQKQTSSVPHQLSSANIFNTYNILAAAAIGQSVFLHEEDSEDEEDSHDEDDDQQVQTDQQPILSSSPITLTNTKNQQLLTSRSFSPSVFNKKIHSQHEQESFKKTLHDANHRGYITKNKSEQVVTSTDILDSCVQNSTKTMLSTNYPSATLGKYIYIYVY